jgi:hypothetical protein
MLRVWQLNVGRVACLDLIVYALSMMCLLRPSLALRALGSAEPAGWGSLLHVLQVACRCVKVACYFSWQCTACAAHVLTGSTLMMLRWPTTTPQMGLCLPTAEGHGSGDQDGGVGVWNVAE